MNGDLEHQLRGALRPVSPSGNFSARVVAALPLVSRRRSSARWWAAAGLAASLLLAAGLQQRAVQQRELQSGQRARRQVIEALQVTNQKLDLALRAVIEESSS